MSMIIYKTRNILDGKIYVGQDIHNNPNYLGSGVYICSAIKKYGKENFVKEIIDFAGSKEDLNEKEKYWIKFYNCKAPNGYNITDGGGGVAGFISWNKGLTKETNEGVKKISESKFGENNPAKRPEVREKLSQNHVGCIISEETKKKISRRLKGKKRKPFSDEWKRNLSDSLSGRTGLVGEKNPMFGKKRYHNEETRKKLRKSYICTSPDKNVIETNNLMEFCSQNNLSYRCMLEIHRYKGWECKRKE